MKIVPKIITILPMIGTTIVIMLGITTGEVVQIGIDTFRSDRIADEVIKG